MIRKPKATFAFHADTYTHGSFTHTRVSVYKNITLDTIESAIAGCVGNAHGYSHQKIADARMIDFTSLRTRGVTHVAHTLGGGTRVELRWQHYGPITDNPETQDYCDPHFETNCSLWELGPKYKLVTRLVEASRKATHAESYQSANYVLRSPLRLLAGLASLGATRLYLHHYASGYPGEWCAGSADVYGRGVETRDQYILA